MNVSNLTVYKNCYNCNTNSWKNTGNQYVSTKIVFAKTTDTKKIKVSLDLTNNVGTYLMASADKDYIRKICFMINGNFSIIARLSLPFYLLLANRKCKAFML